MASIQRVLEALMVMLLALFSMAVLPSLLVQYLYADQNLTEAPALLEFIPVAAFGISVLYTIFVIATNIARAQKIRQMEQDLYFTAGTDEVENAEVDDAELKELEKMVDEAMSTRSTTKKASKKVASKKRK
jgi:hypothetical protein